MKELEVLNLNTWKSEFTEEECNFDKVKEYLNLIKECIDRFDDSRYSERHHVMPKCVDKDKKYRRQFVRINGSDHLYAHMKLVECFNGEKKRLMGCALFRMRKSNFEDISPETYEKVREIFSLSQTGELNHAYGKPNATSSTIWITDGINNQRVSSANELPQGWGIGVTKNLQGLDIVITDGINNKWWSLEKDIPEGWRRGKTQTVPDYSREKNHMYNKIWITNGIENKFIPKEESIPIGWWRGATQNNPDQHGSNSAIYGKVSITNGKENKLIYPNEELPNGWRYGQTQDHSKYGCNFNEGKIYITNGIKNKMIYKDEVIPEGWRKGMTKKSIHNRNL